jgi:hypothetical protein
VQVVVLDNLVRGHLQTKGNLSRTSRADRSPAEKGQIVQEEMKNETILATWQHHAFAFEVVLEKGALTV